MSLLQLFAILILWIGAGFFATLYFFASGYRFEPRREDVPVEHEGTERETA